jgi:hypothetical protein
MTERKRLCSLLLMAVAGIVGCSGGSAAPSPEPTLLTTGPHVRIDAALLSDDSRVLTLSFTGGPEYVANAPCTRAYVGHAEDADGVLEAEVMDVTPPRSLPSGSACTLEGHQRTVTVNLATPFLGSRLDDRAGFVLFLRRPSGLIEIKGLPSAWQLQSEHTLNESPTGQWERVYSLDATPGGYPEIRELDLYQSFGGPMLISGGDGVGKPFQIGDLPGLLYGPDGNGEIVLAWQFDRDGLALVANTADFTPEALIALAETATRN